MRPDRPKRRALPALIVAVVAAVALAACADRAKREHEEEIAKSSIACQYNGEPLIIRFDAGEARMLFASSDRVTLYQISSASGTRYTNGLMELRGKGMDLQLIRDGAAETLAGCQPLVVVK